MAAGLSVDLDRWRHEFDELMLHMSARFARVEPRRRMASFVRGLLADAPARPWRDQPAGTIYRQIAEDARDGRLPPPIILISEPGLANLVVIEGHKRLTGLLVCPQWLPAELDVMLGLTARHHK